MLPIEACKAFKEAGFPQELKLYNIIYDERGRCFHIDYMPTRYVKVPELTELIGWTIEKAKEKWPDISHKFKLVNTGDKWDVYHCDQGVRGYPDEPLAWSEGEAETPIEAVALLLVKAGIVRNWR